MASEGDGGSREKERRRKRGEEVLSVAVKVYERRRDQDGVEERRRVQAVQKGDDNGKIGELRDLIREVAKSEHARKLLALRDSIPSLCARGMNFLRSPLQQEILFLEPPRVFGLCIGADKYVQPGWELENAVRDATRLHLELRRTPRSWSLLKKDPQSRSDLIRFLRNGLATLGGARPELVVLFYAGHGMKAGRAKEDVLIPCDFGAIETEEEVEDYTLSVSHVFQLIKRFEESSKKERSSCCFLVIIDACRYREGLQETERLLPQQAVKDVLPRCWCICYSCSHGEGAHDESEFVQQLLDEREGIFALNRPLREAVMECARRSKQEDQAAVCINLQDLPRFCMWEDGETVQEVVKIKEAVSTALARKRKGGEVNQSAEEDEFEQKRARVVVAAYSTEQVKDFREHVRALLKGFLSSLKEEEPSWRLCSLFLLAFMRDQGTTFSSKSILEYHRSVAAEIGPELVERVGRMLQRGKISSARFDEWRSMRRLEDLSEEKLVVAVLDFTVREEIRRSVDDKEEAEEKIELWEMEAVPSSYSSSVSRQEALDRMERYLLKALCYEGERNMLFAGYVLSKAIETGSFVVVMRMTQVQSIFMSRFLLKSGSGRDTGGGCKELKRTEICFKTIISSSGWLIRHGECRTDWRTADQGWVEELEEMFEQVLEERGIQFERWRDFLQGDRIGLERCHGKTDTGEGESKEEGGGETSAAPMVGESEREEGSAEVQVRIGRESVHVDPVEQEQILPGSIAGVLMMVQVMLQNLKEQADENLEKKGELMRLTSNAWDLTAPVLKKVKGRSEEEETVRVALFQLYFTLKSLCSFIQGQGSPLKHVPPSSDSEAARRLKAQLQGKTSELYSSLRLLCMAMYENNSNSLTDPDEPVEHDESQNALRLMSRELNDLHFETALGSIEDAMGKTSASLDVKDEADETPPWSLDFRELQFETTGRGKPKHVLGKGGFGLVFQGKYKGADVAVKEPHDPEALHEEEALKKSFFREAKNLYRLSHRNVVALVGGIVSDDCGDPCYMMVTELLPQSLQKEMEILQELDGEERCKRQDRLMIELAEGLAYLHSAGIIHKDIKSQNVMVDTSGSPKYIDFGLCKQEQVTTSTASTRLAGTLYWMSPERKRGGAASAKSDVYSLGLLLVYMLTMAKLPEGEEALQEVVRQHAESVSGKLVLCCLREEESTRPTAATVAMSLTLRTDVTVSPIAELRIVTEIHEAEARRDWTALVGILKRELRERVNEEVVRSMLAITDGKEIAVGYWKEASEERRKELNKHYKELWDVGAIEAVIDKMKVWVWNAHVQEMGAHMILLISRGDEGRHRLPFSSRNLPAGIEAIIGGMRRHKQHLGLQEKAMGALLILAINDTNSVRIGITGGIEAIVEAMRLYPDSASIQRLGNGTLRNLTYNDVHKGRVREAGGIEAIVDGMRRHVGNAGVQEWGSAALRNLAYSDENKERVAEVGGIPVVVEGMEAHREHDGVQEWGCAVLEELSNNSNNMNAIMQARGHVAVTRAMETFESNTMIKYSASRLLSRAHE